MTTVVSEKWMERFVINLDVLCSDGLVSSDDPAGGSLDEWRPGTPVGCTAMVAGFMGLAGR